MGSKLANFSIFRKYLLPCFLIVLCSCTKEAIRSDEGASLTFSPKEIAPGVLLGEVYKTNNFASFTDITYFDNAWYIIFRVGTGHMKGLNGQIKIVKSTDAVKWTVQHIFIDDSLDLRDPKFILDSIHNKLYLNYTGVKYLSDSRDPDMGSKVYSFISSYNSTTQTWDESKSITNDNVTGEQFVYWRFTYLKGKLYSAAFRSPLLGGYTMDNLCLFDGDSDFTKYKTIGRLNLGNTPNETTIRFTDEDKMYLLVRRETKTVALGISSPSSYCDVKWTDPIPVRLSSPNFLFYHEKLLMSGRDQDDLKFKFYSYNPSTKKLEKEFTFPSGAETGYAGMSFNPHNPDELWMSYYVITSDKSYINLIKIDLKNFL